MRSSRWCILGLRQPTDQEAQSDFFFPVRVALFDYRKAFDLIDHHILDKKVSLFSRPLFVKRWVIDFLMNRQQRVKLARDCLSEWADIPSGVPHGKKVLLSLSLLFRCFSLFLPHLRTLTEGERLENCLRFGTGGSSLCLYSLLSRNILFFPTLTIAARPIKKISGEAICSRYQRALSEF